MAEKSKKLKIKKLQINLTNRWLYTLIVFFSLIVIGVFVYAVAPSPGHDITEIASPDVCSIDQFLKWDGSAWACADAGGSGLWTQTGSDIYYDAGKVGVGTTTPPLDLHVEGSGYVSGNLGIGEEATSYPLQVVGTAKADVVRGTQFIGDGSGITNLRVVVTPGNEVCDENAQGLLRYRNEICTYDDTMSSFFEICKRQEDTTYGWYAVKKYYWDDEVCDTDGCPGQTYYECTGQYVEPGCYDSEPENCYPGGCFLSGTKVLMADGSYKNIEQVKEGEWVVSYDIENNLKTISKVAYSLVHEDVKGYVIINGELEVTSNHPMWIVNRQKWVQVHTIELGDILLDSNGQEIIVISLEDINGVNTVYNLEIEGDYNNYFAEDILVHNKAPT